MRTVLLILCKAAVAALVLTGLLLRFSLHVHPHALWVMGLGGAGLFLLITLREHADSLLRPFRRKISPHRKR